jgi:hypothetical protein
MKPSQPREVEWSWERSPGWRGQLARTKRWRRRLLSLKGSSDIDTTFDFVLAFFINCYHVRDWLERSGVASDKLDALFRDSIPLRICADIANIAKHHDLTHPPRMTRQLSLAREYEDPGNGWFGDDGALRVLSDGDKYDVLDLAAACEAEWDRFVRTQAS